MNIYLYSMTDHTRLGILDVYANLTVTHRYDEPGELSLSVPLTVPLKPRPGMVLWPAPGGSLANAPLTVFEPFFIDTVEVLPGQDMLSIHAVSTLGLLARRCIVTERAYTGTAGAVLKTLLTEAFTDPKRAFPNLSLAIDTGLGPQITYQTQPMPLLKAVTWLLRGANLGMAGVIDPQTGAIQLTLYEGTDHTAPGIPPVIFDTAYENLCGAGYIDSTTGMANVAYVTGETSTETLIPYRVTVEPDSPTGYARHEGVFHSTQRRKIKDAIGNFYILPDSTYLSMLHQYGQEMLTARPRRLGITGELSPQNALVCYGTDYRLGDVVRVRGSLWGVDINARIRGVTEEISLKGQRIKLQVGEDEPMPASLQSSKTSRGLWAALLGWMTDELHIGRLLSL